MQGSHRLQHIFDMNVLLNKQCLMLDADVLKREGARHMRTRGGVENMSFCWRHLWTTLYQFYFKFQNAFRNMASASNLLFWLRCWLFCFADSRLECHRLLPSVEQRNSVRVARHWCGPLSTVEMLLSTPSTTLTFQETSAFPNTYSLCQMATTSGHISPKKE